MATFLWDGKARQEDDPEVRRPAHMSDALIFEELYPASSGMKNGIHGLNL
jgi:nitrogen fixation-related uncharacterized protein